MGCCRDWRRRFPNPLDIPTHDCHIDAGTIACIIAVWQFLANSYPGLHYFLMAIMNVLNKLIKG